MNSKNGFSVIDDDLPSRFFTQPGSSGDGIIVKPIDRKSFLKARSNYYKVRGLTDNGMPTKEKARELGFE